MSSHYINFITSLHSCTGEGDKMENTKTKQARKNHYGLRYRQFTKGKVKVVHMKAKDEKIPNNEYFIPHFPSTGDVQPLPEKQGFCTHSSCLRRQTL